MAPHEDQVRQGAVVCRNPMKAVFSHLPRPEGTFGLRPKSMTRHEAVHPSFSICNALPLNIQADQSFSFFGIFTGASDTRSSVVTLPFFRKTASG